ncbi:AdoMet_MTases domain containing protein [Burkholderiaceae bacterium]
MTDTSESRFEFGENWQRFASMVTEERITEAVDSLMASLEVDNLQGLKFLDVGCGSGLFSLAARKLGAVVTSFDLDQQSVLCTEALKNKYFKDDPNWTITQGSVLDTTYLQRLEQYEIVYSWGVLHHTGQLWKALSNLEVLALKPEGVIFLAIYNDQKGASNCWRIIKKAYVDSPKWLQHLILSVCYVRLWGATTVRDILKGKPLHTWRNYKSNRGMSPHHDVVDWVGGYPFEVASPEEIFEFFHAKGYELTKLKTCGGGHGCNEFVFKGKTQN